MSRPESYDIFCRVVDNFGDAAVCWRLARNLAVEHRAAVRLWIDDVPTLRQLVPQLRDAYTWNGVTVVPWATAPDSASDVAVEAFGGGLPDGYLDVMSRRSPQPLWIVLEYLSAEDWTSGHHGLPSPHPRHAIERFFFFPGFAPGTGGLIREADLLTRRDAFGGVKRAAFWREHGYAVPDASAIVASVFAYEHAPVEALLDCWSQGEQPVVAAVPAGAVLERALRHLGGASSTGSLELRPLPFLPQVRYDELLWSCDVNLVRGEDSFIRAQWAAKPFVWHVYPQRERAHELKLDAFLRTYCEALPRDAAAAATQLMRAWNGNAADIAPAWQRFVKETSAIASHARMWAGRIADAGELAANLALFCAAKLK